METNRGPVGTKTTRWCSGCQAEVDRNVFSKTQMKKKAAKCKSCCNNGGRNNGQPSRAQCQQPHHSNTEPTPVSLDPRPQRAVPGFEGLTVAKDWPQTKNGRPPNAQSLIYNPLLACALGQPIEGHCSQDELDLAVQWWTLVLPAWPRWMQSLQAVLADEKLRQQLYKNQTGRPNALIPKTKGRGTVPHFKGISQNQILAMAPTTEVEVYACVTCLYSAAALDKSEQEQCIKKGGN